MERWHMPPENRSERLLLPRIAALTVLIMLVLSIAVGAAFAAESHYLDDNAEGGLYLCPSVKNGTILQHQTRDVLRWKDIDVTAQFLNPHTSRIEMLDPDELEWKSSNEKVARYVGNDQIHTYAASDAPVTLTAQYTFDSKPYEATITLNVQKLKVAADHEVLRYAALSQLAYTDLSGNLSGQNVEKILTPASSGGSGVQMAQADMTVLASHPSIETTANLLDFVVAGAGDCTFISRRSYGSFSASVFRWGGKTIIAYRGTAPDELGDLLSDVRLGLGLVEKDQFPVALELCKDMISTWGKSNVVVTGHSLGGGLANYAALLTGVKACTFNAPSTVVTAVSNFEPDLIKNYKGLNDGQRTDYANSHDWVGKVGVGDSKSDLWTGLRGNAISGNLDRTSFMQRAVENTSEYGKAFINHNITRMVAYDPEKEELSLTPRDSSTNPSYESFYWPLNATCYYFGSTGSDLIARTLHPGILHGYAFGGSGSDTLLVASNITPTDKKGWDVVGGEGDDHITSALSGNDTYHYYIGHGTDTIIDHAGADVLKIYGSADIACVEQSDGTVHVIDKSNGDFIIAKLNISGTSGNFIVRHGSKEFVHSRRQLLVRTFTAKCPVNVEILDSDGQVVATAYDGAPSSGSGEYGSYSVYAAEGGYAKSVTLTDSGYSIRVVGVGEGTMSCVLSYESEDGTKEWRLTEIPVHAGSFYYPSDEYADDCIILCDLNGDGSIDYSPIYTKAESVSLPATAQMAYGETLTLTASVQPASANPDLIWSSDHPEIVSVDENGVLEAAGFGSATITCYAVDGSGSSASMTVTVAEETLSASDFVISGVQARYDYTGHAVDPEITVTFRGKTLKKDVHYRVDYLNDLMPGTASVLVEGIAPFAGSVTLEYEIYLYQPSTVDEQVEYLAQQCIASGVQGEYETALWMHDWLTANAKYDYTYTEYYPEGVLLKGTGVCQSYALAYQLLLNRMGIENQVITSEEMDHAWNLVKLDGEWCHIDCTWDDPGMGGGENHNYFGMNDALISRDHVWPRSPYPDSTALSNYYPVRMGLNCVDSRESMESLLAAMVANETTEFEFCYIGSDESFSIWDVFDEWYSANNWLYGLRSYSIKGTTYRMEVSFTYTEPWEEPVNRLDPPVAAPDFSVNSFSGRIRLSDYRHNSMILVFGSEDCPNTISLLDRLAAEAETLKNGGIETLICMDGVTNLSDLITLSARYPSLNFAGEQSGLWLEYLQSVKYTGSLIYPFVFVVNSDPAITYYSTGYVTNLDTLMGEAFATATNNPLPVPGENEYSQGIAGTGSITQLPGDVPAALRSLCTDSNQLLFITDNAVYYDSLEIMAEFEANYSLYSRFGMRMAASFMNYEEGELEQLKAEYPHVTFLDYGDGGFFWDLLSAAGFNGVEAYYKCAYQIGQDGSIFRYMNGSLLSPSVALIEGLDGMACDASMPESLSEIQAEAFVGMSFRTVDLTDTRIYSIGSRAFADCDEMTLIIIPKSVRSIAADAFDGCDHVTIFCMASSYAHRYALEHHIPCLVK